MGRPDPMQADHQSDPHHEVEHDQYEHPQKSDTTCGDIAASEYPKVPVEYPSTGTNHMINQQQQFQSTTPIPPARPNPASQVYPPPAGIPYPQVYQQQQQYQGPVQFPPANPLPQVYQQPISAAPFVVQHQFNETITAGIPIQQQQQTYPSGTPTVADSSDHMRNASATNGWTTGLFGCMEDPLNAIITVFFPCLTFGQIAEMIDEESSCECCAIMYFLVGYFTGLPCLLSCSYRTKLRGQFNLDETPLPDCVAHFFCECCALCQAYRELSNRGFDPSIGWEENQERMRKRKQQAQEMVAPKNQSMM